MTEQGFCVKSRRFATNLANYRGLSIRAAPISSEFQSLTKPTLTLCQSARISVLMCRLPRRVAKVVETKLLELEYNMDYYVRSQLPILVFEKEPESLDRASIRQALSERPCNLVFVEVQDKLYGVVSYGDISRAENERVPVNRSFTSLKDRQFMQAREIFHNHDNIREIPALDNEGRLVGMYSKNDDLLYLEYDRPWEGNRYARSFLESLKTVRIVRTPRDDVRRRKIVDRWIEDFQNYGVSCELIDFNEISKLQHENTPILLVDEETNIGARTTIELLDGDEYLVGVVQTFRRFRPRASEHAYDELIEALANSGIKIYNLRYSEDESTEGRRRLWKGMREWSERAAAQDCRSYVTPSYAKNFYGELNVGDYANQVGGKLPFCLVTNSVYNSMKDVQSPYLNVVNGRRVTVGQPQEAERVVWFFGPCLMVGSYVEDKHTIESLLQARLNREGYSCKVENCGCYEETPYQEMIHLASSPIKPGDVVVIYLDNRFFDDAENIDLMEVLDQNDVPIDWLLERPTHCNHKTNQIYADELFNRMARDGILVAPAPNRDKIDAVVPRELVANSLYLDLYCDNFHPSADELIGFVGMHANPFTRGHRYLVETASKQVDRLFVGLLEEELGLFSFAERMAMVAEGVRDLPNVQIILSGPFQGTRNDFPEYFLRVEPSDMRKNAEADMLFFAKAIAKRLRITRRFVGDERHNPKMSYFNELLKEILPRFGIEVVEIPRAQAANRSITASDSRRAAVEGDYETLRANLPETTLNFLFDIDEYAKRQCGEN